MFRGRHRGLPLLALVALLLGVVAWAAHGTTTGRTDAGTSPAVSPSVASSVLNLVVAAAWGATIVVLIYLAVTVRRRREEFEDPENQQVVKAWWLPWVAMLIIIATVAIPLALVGAGKTNEELQTPAASQAPAPDVTSADRTRPSGWTTLAVLAGAAAASFLFRRRSRPSADDRVALPDELVRLVDETIEELQSDPDPRRAIIHAYVRMERALAKGGRPRRPSETPFEYIDAALQRLMVPPAPARSLTELFEVARFSERPLDASMKRRAIDCLLEVRHALASEVA
jgi:hypothetical protein